MVQAIVVRVQPALWGEGWQVGWGGKTGSWGHRGCGEYLGALNSGLLQEFDGVAASRSLAPGVMPRETGARNSWQWTEGALC